jgi:hypothetical protein
MTGTLMWSWTATAPGSEGGGVCHEMTGAKRAASQWMRAHGADSGIVEAVRLAVGTGNLLTRHERTGVVLRARRGRDGRVRWARDRAIG